MSVDVYETEPLARVELLVPVEMLEAKEAEHRLELAKAQMQLACYREALEEHGIEPPDKSAAELLQMWRDCAAVISSASDMVVGLGTAKELLSRTPWRHVA